MYLASKPSGFSPDCVPIRATFLPDESSLSSPRIDIVGLEGHRQATGFHLVNLAALHEATLVTFDRRITQALVAADQHLVQVLD